MVKNRQKQGRVLRLFAVVALAAVLMLTFTACIGGGSGGGGGTGGGTSATQGSGIDASQLAGTWKEVDIENVYVFNADGTGSESIFGVTFDMTWRVEGSHLYLDFIDSESEDYDIELNGDTLIVHNPTVDYEYKKQ